MSETRDARPPRMRSALATSLAIALAGAVVASCGTVLSADPTESSDAGDGPEAGATDGGTDGEEATPAHRLYVVGGQSSLPPDAGGGDPGVKTIERSVRSAPIFDDGHLGAWRDETLLPAPRSNYSLVAGRGKLYALGGFDGTDLKDTVLASTIAADGRLSAWTNVSVVPAGFDTSATSDGRFLHLLGGERNTAERDTRVDFADLQAGSNPVFAQTASLVRGRTRFAATRTSTHVLAMGGLTANIGVATTSVEIAMAGPDGKLAAWTETAPLPSVLFDEAAAAVGDDVFVLGGFVSSAQGTVYRSKVANGKVNPWVPAVSLPSPRFSLCAAAAGRFIFTIGGIVSNGNAETYLDEVVVAPVDASGVPGPWSAVTKYPIRIAKTGCAAF